MAKAKKKTPAKKRGLRKVPHSKYEFEWDGRRDRCHFKHQDGTSCEVGCGLTDTVMVYTTGKEYVVLSMNYEEGYACVEVIDEEGIRSICFADPSDVSGIFGPDLSKRPPKAVAEKLMSIP
jgi:hypothetical protein